MTKLDLSILVLAAGEGRRMGMPKQLLVADKQPLIRRIALELLSLDYPLVIVLGAREALIRPVLEDLPLSICTNPNWTTGMAGTLNTGLQYVLEERPDTQAIVTCLSDQPYLSAAIPQALIAAYQEQRQPIVASRYTDETLGVPALFDRQMFPALQALEGHEGARSLFIDHQKELSIVDFPRGNQDLDRPEDWETYLQEQKKDMPE